MFYKNKPKKEMMNNYKGMLNMFIVSMIFLTPACNNSIKSKPAEKTEESRSLPYSKSDLYKIKWIEGKWKGMYNGNPFYEIYELKNDTLMITSYEWDGKDSSQSSVSYVAWKDDAFYLGEEQNYKVTVLTDSVIKMIPVKANNDITWRKKDETGWDAVLVGKNATNVYNMEWFDPFKRQ